MKSLIAFISMTFMTSLFAQNLPCNGNLEAQFIAQYDHVSYSYPEAGNLEGTSFGFKNFRHFSPNINCPMSLGLAQIARVLLPTLILNIQDGNEVSGILVYNPKFNTFFID